ncbi:MAG: MFS transporter [Deltaproteobacteria bacterium]|nr:MFS transporter [Deltaproteobacteria bacterium]
MAEKDETTPTREPGEGAGGETARAEEPKGPWWREVTQPFVDVVRAPRALWGINLSYWLEGLVYFGVLGYLAMYFNQYVGMDDSWAGYMTGTLTWGITFAMFLFGGLADKWGVRIALLAALALMVLGRGLLALGPTIGLGPDGPWSPVHFTALAGILFVVLGYGMYQPAAYAAVRQFTTPKTAGMGYAMLYALMNLGGWIPTFFPPIRKAIGISGTYWVFTGLTMLGLLFTAMILTRKVAERAIADAKAAKEKEGGGKKDEGKGAKKEPAAAAGSGVWNWLKNHPLADGKFAFFIFCLIPVQTLFAHNWLTLPMYVERAYRGTWIGANFEVATNFNPLLIFIFVPVIAALTQKRKVYNLMIVGTAVMAAPTFLLALGPSPYTLGAYLVLMTVGEAIWQPRFLQYAAEIAPEGRTGAYMGVAQFPWFLTKMITSLYSGWFLANYCPDEGAMATETMWLIYGLIAMSSTVLLIVARPWLGKDFKEKS